MTDEYGKETIFTYDAKANLIGVTEGSGAEARTTVISRTPEGYVEQIQEPESRITKLRRDLAGRITQVQRPDGGIAKTEFDVDDNMISFAAPGRPAYRASYDSKGRLAGYEPPTGGGAAQAVSCQVNKATDKAALREWFLRPAALFNISTTNSAI